MSNQSILTTLLLAMITWGCTVSQSLAANGSIRFRNGVVTILGDDYMDHCWVNIDGNEIQIVLRVHDAEGNIDDIDDRDYDYDDVDLIIFRGFDGEDCFWNRTNIPSIAYGGGGDDAMWGGTSRDRFYGGSGDDAMWGGSSSDVLCGGGGDDAMWGQSGSDSLFGNDGHDRLYGGTGDDYLNAGRGEDEWIIKGESGHDTFAVPATLAFRWWLVPIGRVVLIYDFDPNEDTEVLFVPTWYSYLLPESVWEFFP